jgi:hypothetical protein
MKNLSRILFFTWALVAAALPTGTSAQSQTKSEAVRDCEDIKACVPDTASLVVAYVNDVEGHAIAGMTVEAVSDKAASSSPAQTALTDRAGMAAVSLTPGQSYSVRIADRGWMPFASEPSVAASGGTRLLRVTMRVRSIEH